METRNVTLKEQIVLDVLDYMKSKTDLGPRENGCIKYMEKCIKAEKKVNDLRQKCDEFWHHWEEAGVGLDSGYSVPEMYYFAITEGEIDDYEDFNKKIKVAEVYMDFKANVWMNKGKFDVEDNTTYATRISDLPSYFLDDDVECPDGIFCIPISETRTVETIRADLIKAKFEELPQAIRKRK